MQVGLWYHLPMAKLTGFIPDHVLKNYIQRGQTVTIIGDSLVNVTDDKGQPQGHFHTFDELSVVVSNLLPGYDDVYVNPETFKQNVHNPQVVWVRYVTRDSLGNEIGPGWFLSTDINNVKEIRDGKN